MYHSSYEGLIEPWKVQLIAWRARRTGLKGHDLEDALQQIVMQLIEFRYDPTKVEQATEKTALISVIDKQLAMIRRRESRHRRKLEGLKRRTLLGGGDQVDRQPAFSAEERAMSLTTDVREAIAELPPLAQNICDGLLNGDSVRQISDRLGMSWRAVHRQICGIRGYFEFIGIGGWIHSAGERGDAV